ncbi:MAG: ImmA/IrrE family metallo-endopeptidase [Bacteroidales bacterium]|nr:ImmA/IrrE family metallo-endopeptidase [Bacteroidales bacterium]
MKPVRTRASFARAQARQFAREFYLNSPPVNVEELIKNFASIIWTREVNDGLTIFNEKNSRYFVFINHNNNNGRLNWTLAHELGHIVLDHFVYYDLGYLTSEGEKILDREANIFTAEILLPEKWIWRYCDLPLTVQKIGRAKDLLEVSWEALINRIDDLGITSKQEIRRMFNEYREPAESVFY